MGGEKRFYMACVSFLLLVPITILAIGFVYKMWGRVVTLVLMAAVVLAMYFFPLKVTGDLYEFEKDMSTRKKILILLSILTGALIGISASLTLGFF